MSTRCQVFIEGEGANVSIYRHSDGYPETACGVLRTLLPFINKFVKDRGRDDWSYMAAQLVGMWLMERHESYKHEPYKSMKKTSLASFRWLGYGIEAHDESKGQTFHGDEEYIYVVKQDHVEIRHTLKGFRDNPVLANTEVIGRRKFNGRKHVVAPVPVEVGC